MRGSPAPGVSRAAVAAVVAVAVAAFALSACTLSPIPTLGSGGDASGGGGSTVVAPSLEFVLPPPAVAIGASVPLTVVRTDTNGVTEPVTVTWSSTADTIAAVSDSGRLYGITDGTALITATTPDSLSATISMNVTGTGQFPATAEVDMPSGRFAPDEVHITVGGYVNFVFPAAQNNVVFTGSTPGTPGQIPPTSNATVKVIFPLRGLYSYVSTLYAGAAGVVVVH